MVIGRGSGAYVVSWKMVMSKRERNWRPSLLTIEDIQYDLRIGATKFYRWIAQGLMPPPHIKSGGVSRWLTSQVLEAIENFPNHDEIEAERRLHEPDHPPTTSPWADQRAS